MKINDRLQESALTRSLGSIRNTWKTSKFIRVAATLEGLCNHIIGMTQREFDLRMLDVIATLHLLAHQRPMLTSMDLNSNIIVFPAYQHS